MVLYEEDIVLYRIGAVLFTPKPPFCLSAQKKRRPEGLHLVLAEGLLTQTVYATVRLTFSVTSPVAKMVMGFSVEV